MIWWRYENLEKLWITKAYGSVPEWYKRRKFVLSLRLPFTSHVIIKRENIIWYISQKLSAMYFDFSTVFRQYFVDVSFYQLIHHYTLSQGGLREDEELFWFWLRIIPESCWTNLNRSLADKFWGGWRRQIFLYIYLMYQESYKIFITGTL